MTKPRTRKPFFRRPTTIIAAVLFVLFLAAVGSDDRPRPTPTPPPLAQTLPTSAPTIPPDPSPTPSATATPTRDPRAILSERYAAALADLPNVHRVEIASITPAQPRTIIHAELFVLPTADYRALADAAFRQSLAIAATAFVDFEILLFAPNRCESWAFDTRRDDWRITPLICPSFDGVY